MDKILPYSGLPYYISTTIGSTTQCAHGIMASTQGLHMMLIEASVGAMWGFVHTVEKYHVTYNFIDCVLCSCIYMLYS